MSTRGIRWFRLFFIVFFCFALVPTPAAAETLQSPHYQFDESTLGAGGLIQSNSANYQSSSSTGDIGVGNSASSGYQINAGSQTTNDPTLSFSVNTLNADLGNFTASGPTVTTATFSVSNYTSYGYIAQIVGTSPTNNGHAIAPLSTTSTSQAGTDQFGINLVANTSPLSVGANPDNGSFGYGTVAPNYAASNKYRYVSGETIASAPKSSGTTTYTITYLVNVNSLTPGGKYTSDQTIIVTGTY
jgi:hypothetical protein